jgi:hypothetical protein
MSYITLGWMTIEGAAALLLGWASKSLLLEALPCWRERFFKDLLRQ